jgi:hypothetical protein
VTDYAHNPHAARDRLEKAKAIARWLWDRGVTAAQLDAYTDAEWSRVSRLAADRSASDHTRLVTYGLMIVKEAWAAANPAADGARRTLLTDEQATALAAPARRRT